MASPTADKTNVKPRRKRRWFQFGLPTLLGLVTLSAVVLGLIVNSAERQRRAVAAVRSLGGVVYYEDDKPFAAGPPFWLRKWFGPDYIANVVAVYLTDTHVGDAGLESLTGLTRLQVLDLSNTRISDAGLAHLSALTGLRTLYLYNTPVSDAGLEHLKALTGLRELYLDNGQLSDAGLAELRAALPHCDIQGP